MAGFMAQKGTLIVCGDAGEAFADSMYEAVCFVGGRIGELGNDAVIKEPTEKERAFLQEVLSRHLPEKAGAGEFKKVVSGRKLWNFNKQERAVWREAL
jgi:glutamate synthase domain-containing protein 3